MGSGNDAVGAEIAAFLDTLDAGRSTANPAEMRKGRL
jgi:hypothetical protein